MSQSPSTAIIINRVIEPFGRYQILLAFILCYNDAIVAISHTVTTFYIFTPENYSCARENATITEEKCVTGCKNYSFEGNEVSIVTEWSLVCDRRYLSALINTIYFIGVMLGSSFWGILADKFGRKIAILVCLYLQGIFGASLYFAPSLEVFIALRFLQGLFIQGLFNNSFVLIQELTPPRFLTITGLAYQTSWSVGMSFLGIAAYFVRDWRQLQLILAIPTLLTLSWSWLIVESLTWSIENGKGKEALRNAMKIAERNKDHEFIKEYKEIDTLDIEVEKLPEKKPSNGVYLVKNQILLKHFVITLVMGLGINISYFTILLNSPSLPLGPHVSFIIGAATEIVTNILAMILIHKTSIGRRTFTIVSNYSVGLICLIHGVLIYFGNTKSKVLAVMGTLEEGIAVAMFSTVLVYAVELFPTVLRTTALGFIGVAGKMGSILAPQLNLLGEVVNPILPLVVIGILLVFSGSLSFFTPETKNKKLPNSIQDVETVWGKKKN